MIEQVVKPCPFCGEPASVSHVYDQEEKYYFYRVECSACYANFTGSDQPDLIRYWNRRPARSHE